MKILLLGDYSNYHACLGQALAKKGHSVTVASDGGRWMQTARTISLDRSLPGKVGGMLLFARIMLDSRIKGYDIVSLINPSFVTLHPKRLKTVFNKLKKENGRVFLGSVGTDKAIMDFLTSPDCPLRYSEYYNQRVLYTPNEEVLNKDNLWQKGAIGNFCEYVYDNVDGVTTALYEYHLAMQRKLPEEKIAYAGIPINTSKDKHTLYANKKTVIFLGRHSYRKKFKGTDRLESVTRRVLKEFPDKCIFTIVEDQPYSIYLERLKEADVVLDQLYSYSPATNALLAMADGRCVVSGGEPEYYDFINEYETRPIVNAVPDDEQLYEIIKNLVLNPEKVSDLGKMGPKFVAKHNDSSIVAQRCLDFWTSKF